MDELDSLTSLRIAFILLVLAILGFVFRHLIAKMLPLPLWLSMRIYSCEMLCGDALWLRLSGFHGASAVGALIGLSYLLVTTEFSKQPSWNPPILAFFIVITLANVLLWANMALDANDGYMSTPQIAAAVVCVCFSMAKWVLTAVYVFQASFNFAMHEVNYKRFGSALELLQSFVLALGYLLS